MFHRHLLFLGLLLQFTAVSSFAAERRPNILFIMVDEMKWDVMSCAGHPIVKTPNLDRLAHEGTRFATTYTAAPICTPSRYSLFSSRYAHVHGATDNGTAPGEPLLLLPELLRHNGYETAISGKLHFIPGTLEYGFDHFWSFSNEGPHKLPTWPEFLEKKHGLAASRKLLEQPFRGDPLGGDLGKVSYPKEDTQTFWLADRALEFLQTRDKEKPFFLYLSFLDPHSPSHLADPYWNMFDAEKMPLPASFHQDPSKPLESNANRHEVNDPKIVRAMTAAYYAKVTMVDDNIGRVLKQLDEQGLADNTLIVFSADHGNMLGDHNHWFKGVMYESSARIPLMIKAAPSSQYAAQFNHGKVINQIVENIDVMPTLCGMAHVPLPSQGIQGKSVVDLVSGKTTDWKNQAFAERGSSMVRTEQYKLIHNDRKVGYAWELYDLKADPLEEHDLGKDPAFESVYKDLKARLEAWQKDHPPVPEVPGLALQPKPGGDAVAEDPKTAKRARKRKKDA